jgi:transposase-like protein
VDEARIVRDAARAATPGSARTYSDAEKKAALELAASIGFKPAAKRLGLGNATIFRWRNDDPVYWASLKNGDPGARQHRIADNLEDLADAYGEAEREAISQAYEQLESGELGAKELAALIKAFGASRGVANAGARAVRGEDAPQQINVNFPALEQAMERLLIGAAPAVDSTLTELEP